MCGIAGIVSFRGNLKQPLAMQLVRKMCSLLKHRGPDDDAFYSDGNVSIGMTRLAILDLRKGLYPLTNESKNLYLFYNGEIYNSPELSSELAGNGHQFGSLTDGEVIVHGFEQWGPGCLTRFNGMWAFALWETSEQKLLLGRDHFGIKPLYYYVDEDLLAFSSEIGALLSLPFIKKNPNEKSIYNYLVDGRVDHTEETFYDSIYRLMPGHYAVAKPDGSFEKTRYWKMPSVCEEADAKDMSQASERVRSLFIDAVRIRLRSDVPVGTCLSGGLDSSSIASVIAGLNNGAKESIGKRLQGFSACYPGDPIDESHFVKIAAQATGTDSHVVCPTALEFWRDLTELVRTQGEPFGGASIYASWRVMQMAKANEVPVLLDGQGGDELFAGYLEYLWFYVEDLLRRGKIMTALKETFRSLDVTAPMIPLLFTYRRKIRKAIRNYLNPAFSAKFAKNPDRLRIDSESNLARVLWNDVTRHVLPSLLRYEDENSMRFSIETRLPFLDPRLVEYVSSLPIDFKIRDGCTKRIFREAMRGILPEEIRLRRDKIGFETPQRRWFLAELADNIEELLSTEMRASEFVKRNAVLGLFRSARSNNKISRWDAEFIWRCINLEFWLREFIPLRTETTTAMDIFCEEPASSRC
jgi:asparagine synthase (glutamine-hydrolysing)